MEIACNAIVVQVAVDSFELGGLGHDELTSEPGRFAYVLALRALGQVRQTVPLVATQLKETPGTLQPSCEERFEFEAVFDSGWADPSLRRLLAGERLRADLLRVPLEDECARRREDLGAKRLAAFAVQPWPWAQAGGLCASTDFRRTLRPAGGPAAGRTAAGGEALWLRMQLHARIFSEVARGERLQLPRSGDVIKVPCEPGGAPQNAGSALRRGVARCNDDRDV